MARLAALVLVMLAGCTTAIALPGSQQAVHVQTCTDAGVGERD
jgi:hypothetical protein